MFIISEALHMKLEFLKPLERLRVMDLVREVGIDVSEWGDYQRGEENAASNPKYCYEWTFQDHEKELIVLSLWFENLETRGKAIIQKLNLRTTAEEVESAAQKRRAYDMDFALQKAYRLNLPLRVILCDGTQRNKTLGTKRSKTDARLLDEESWVIESYDRISGDCILVRGPMIDKFIDQFHDSIFISIPVNKTEHKTSSYSRNPLVRKLVLERADGRCEYCGSVGFSTSAGSIYLETHHIIPLAERGEDSSDNVIALCPNHHRQAHYGSDIELFRTELFARIGLKRQKATDY